MKKKMIIVGTDDGIILDVSRCAIFDENELSEADQTLLNFGTESDALSVANRHGTKLSDILEGCGYGDLNYYNSLALSPLALRSEFEEFPYISDEVEGVAEVKAILEWGSKLSDTQLMNLAAYALQDDDLWNQWRTTVIWALQEFYAKFQEASKE